MKIPAKQEIVKRIYELGGNDELVAVAKCESGLKQFENGEPLKSYKGTPDFGVFQINSVHFPEAERLGLDVMKLDDNIRYAVYLYRKAGLNAWYPSFQCWSKLLADG